MLEKIKNWFRKKDAEVTHGYIQVDVRTIIMRASAVRSAGHEETANAAYKVSDYLVKAGKSAKPFYLFWQKDENFIRKIGIRADHWLVNDKAYQKLINIKPTSKIDTSKNIL